MITVHEVWTGNRLRFASLRQDEAHAHAQRIYTAFRVIADIVTYEREAIDFRQQERRAA